MKAMAKQQRGVSFFGLVAWAFVLIILAIYGMKIIPAYTEAKSIQNVLEQMARDPEMQNAPINDIQNAFWKRGLVMNNITEVSQQDLVVDKRNDKLVLSVHYAVKIPVAGNATLVLDFNPSSTPAR